MEEARRDACESASLWGTAVDDDATRDQRWQRPTSIACKATMQVKAHMSA